VDYIGIPIVGQGRAVSYVLYCIGDDVTCAKLYLSDCTRRGRRRDLKQYTGNDVGILYTHAYTHYCYYYYYYYYYTAHYK